MAGKRGKALYDYAGNAEQRQLSFKKGDTINVTNQYDNGWWAGELNGTLGYFPATYVELFPEGGAPAAAAATKPAAAKPAPAATQNNTAAAAAPVSGNRAVTNTGGATTTPKPAAVTQPTTPKASLSDSAKTQTAASPTPKAASPTSVSTPQKPAAVSLKATNPKPSGPVSPRSAAAGGGNSADVAELDALISQLERDAQELNRLLNN